MYGLYFISSLTELRQFNFNRLLMVFTSCCLFQSSDGLPSQLWLTRRSRLCKQTPPSDHVYKIRCARVQKQRLWQAQYISHRARDSCGVDINPDFVEESNGIRPEKKTAHFKKRVELPPPTVLLQSRLSERLQ